jgi:hypothetical protein
MLAQRTSTEHQYISQPCHKPSTIPGCPAHSMSLYRLWRFTTHKSKLKKAKLYVFLTAHLKIRV